MNLSKSKNDKSASNQIWKENDQKANKEGPHAKVYWVKGQKKSEDGSKHRSQWKFSHCYQGSWENNIKSGFGIQFFENGDKYEGEWAGNCRNGFGTYWVKNDNKKLLRNYTGHYLADQKHGKGTMFFETGNRYDGHWERNEITGFGRMIYTNGDVYTGHWVENKRHGYGVFTKINGDYYEGNWLLDKREGYGTYLFAANHKIIIGEWSEDTPKSSVLYKLSDEEKEIDLDNKNGLLKSTILKKRMHLDSNELNIKINNLVFPVLQLEDPVEALENALKDVRRERLGFRVLYSPVESLLAEVELGEMADQFRVIANEDGVGSIDEIKVFLGGFEGTDLESVMVELAVESDKVYFEDFVRLVVYRDNLRELIR